MVLAAVSLLAAVAVLAAAARPALAQPVPTAPIVLDGPSAAITGLHGFSIARDGSGGLVYLKQVGGVAHVFVSRLVSGRFQPPARVDQTLAGASSQPVIAAGNGGVLLIAFINGSQLYVVDRLGTSAPYSAPIALAGGASNPAIQMTNFGKAYIAFTVASGGGSDVRAAYYYNGAWSLESAPLNAVPGDDAGTGAGRPAVAAAGDGVAIVVWGEDGHVYSRRVWGTSPSVVDEQADPATVSGCSEVSAGDPGVGSGGDSSYAAVVFQETVSCGGVQQSRVLMNRLQGSVYDGAVTADGIAPGSAGGADQPAVAITEYGRGLVTDAHDPSDTSGADQLFGMTIDANAAPGGVFRADSLQNTAQPDAVPAIAGLYSDLIAWQQDPGTSGPPEIRVRYATADSSLGAEMVLSSPGMGATDANLGLAAAGDVDGDAAVAWVQGSGGSTEIVAALMYHAPGSPGVARAVRYVRSVRPTLSFTAARESWGPVQYSVLLDGAAIATTTATSVPVPTPLRDGRYDWQVEVTNPAGLAARSSVGTVFVDTVAPTLHISVTGRRQVGGRLALHLSYRDAPPPGLPAADASGVAKVTVRWTARTTSKLRVGTRLTSHTYTRAGRYRVVVTVVDRAGNATSRALNLKIAAARSRRRR